jgi:uncharacterized membrane protein
MEITFGDLPSTAAAATTAPDALTDGWTRGLALATTVSTGLVAGVFFAFSTFVMAGLRRLPPAQGMAAMQSVNRAAPSPLFMLVLFGTAVGDVVLAVAGLRDLGRASARYHVAAAAVYVLAIVVTVTYHVPRNDALATRDPQAPGSAAAWRTYARNWTALNHVRTAASTVSAVLLALSLRAG